MLPTATSEKTRATVLLVCGLMLLFVSVALQSKDKNPVVTNMEIQKFPIQTLVSNGHREFAWTIIAINTLAATVNAWNSKTQKGLEPEIQNQSLAKFEESLDAIPGLARESLGMLEVFMFPASFLAFEVNDIDRAIEVARAGSTDPRLQADLVLSVAYLSHIFKGNLNQAADDYELLLTQFPNATWIKETIVALRSGVDPFKREGRNRTIICNMLQRAFPLARKRLIERGVCNKPTPVDGIPHE